MRIYRVEHIPTVSVHEINAPFSALACKMLDLDETECRVTLIADLPFAGIAALPEGTNLERRFIIGPRAAARVAAHPSPAPGRRGDRAVRQLQ